ncbi:AEC family transporter [Candidatus Bipolaricaulota bacterium]|nr:AEC family transporter [Candidatus Bipolaricaulota bacterium]
MILEVIGPTFLLVLLGYVFGRLGKIPARPFAEMSFWLLSPALIFETLRTAQLPAKEAGFVALFVLVHYGGMFLLSLPLGRKLFPSDADARRATNLLLTFGNCGNLGLPILLFAYGQRAVDVGVIFLAANTVLLSTLGVGIAAWRGRLEPCRFLRDVLAVPWPYAVVLALIMRFTGAWPAALGRASALLAQAAIPLFLLLLGLELAAVDFHGVAKPAVLLALARLVFAALLAWLLAPLFAKETVIRRSLVIEGSVPSAVNAYILATQYHRRPDLAATALLLSTLLSLGTFSLTLFLLARFG